MGFMGFKSPSEKAAEEGYHDGDQGNPSKFDNGNPIGDVIDAVTRSESDQVYKDNYEKGVEHREKQNK